MVLVQRATINFICQLILHISPAAVDNLVGAFAADLINL